MVCTNTHTRTHTHSDTWHTRRFVHNQKVWSREQDLDSHAYEMRSRHLWPTWNMSILCYWIVVVVALVAIVAGCIWQARQGKWLAVTVHNNLTASASRLPTSLLLLNKQFLFIDNFGNCFYRNKTPTHTQRTAQLYVPRLCNRLLRQCSQWPRSLFPKR